MRSACSASAAGRVLHGFWIINQETFRADVRGRVVFDVVRQVGGVGGGGEGSWGLGGA